MTHTFRIISAGAGSGKTYRLTSEMLDMLRQGVRPSGIIATTFTQKAAAELQERVRVRLLEAGMSRQADELANALIGTVHSLGVKLLQRFAFEAGVSPAVEIIAEEDQQSLFNNSLAMVLSPERADAIDRLCHRLGMHSRTAFDWRKQLRELTDIARANAFDEQSLQQSKIFSWQSFAQYLPAPAPYSEAELHQCLAEALADTIARVENNGDETVKTANALKVWKDALRIIRLEGALPWRDWAKILKTEVAVKSKDDVAPLLEAARLHEASSAFQKDVQDYIFHIFDAAGDALREYAQYKKSRGLIDYTDMETHILRLLDHPQVRQILAQELDLLMVDEFQDTNPIQLEIFLKLSRLAPCSIWVGDPKQSIYGFRGADPQLMQAIIAHQGGIRPDDIQRHSWRSRSALVNLVNALFTQAFPELPTEQVALQSKREEPNSLPNPLIHWHFRAEGDSKRMPAAPWAENCIAHQLRDWLQGGVEIWDKDHRAWRPARPGDVAILCRSNEQCRQMAQALHQAGLRASVARTGLLATAEARLVTACLKYILHHRDALSAAEILLLGGRMDIEDIIEDRLEYLDQLEQQRADGLWAKDHPLIQRLLRLRKELADCSSAEMLDIVLETLDLRRIIAAWGNASQRLDNVEALRRLALQYEDNCARLHTAASLGGFLLWLSDLENKNQDMQAASEDPDAVQVLTYHKSKGLEWPIAICHSLHTPLRADLWGFEIVPQTDAVNLDNLLGNRLLRCWVNPYGDQAQRTPLMERLQAGPEQAQATQKALREEARLLYVGFTRARDYLVLPTFAGAPPKWLNRVWHHGQEDYPVLDPSSNDTPWVWDGQDIAAHTEVLVYPKDFTHSEPADAPCLFIEARHGRMAHAPAYIDLQRETLSPVLNVRADHPAWYAPVPPVQENADRYAVAKCLKAWLAARQPSYPPEELEAMAARLLVRFRADNGLKTQDMLNIGTRWEAFLKQAFQPKATWRKQPVLLDHEGRLFSAVLDLVLDTPDGLVLIQNSSFDSQAYTTRLEARAELLAPWLHLAKTALQATRQTHRVRTWVHFVLSAAVVEVHTETYEGK